jgi:AraC-like DNA-binding protein
MLTDSERAARDARWPLTENPPVAAPSRKLRAPSCPAQASAPVPLPANDREELHAGAPASAAMHTGAAPSAVGNGLPKPITFSTLGLPKRQQFEAWHESCAGTMDFAPMADPAAGFPAEGEAWTLGPIALATVRVPAARLWRTAAQVRRSSLDHWLISITRCGERRVSVGDLCVSLPAGLPSISSLDEVFESDRTDIDWIGLYVPRDAVTEIGPALNASRAIPLDTSMGRILAAYLIQLASELPRLDETDLARVVECTRAIVAASISPSAEAMAVAKAPIEQVQLARIKTIIRQNLRSAMLGPERLCRLAGVSRSQLYRLFEPRGGVAHYIQAERLRAACRALAALGGGRDISAIAQDVGFFDHSTFSRIFRREFGCTPREFRTAAMTGQAAAARQAGAPRREACDLAGLLRQL